MNGWGGGIKNLGFWEKLLVPVPPQKDRGLELWGRLGGPKRYLEIPPTGLRFQHQCCPYRHRRKPSPRTQGVGFLFTCLSRSSVLCVHLSLATERPPGQTRMAGFTLIQISFVPWPQRSPVRLQGSPQHPRLSSCKPQPDLEASISLHGGLTVPVETLDLPNTLTSLGKACSRWALPWSRQGLGDLI